MNVLSGVVPTNKTKSQKFETELRQLSDKKFGKESTSKLFQTARGHRLIQLLAKPCLQYLQEHIN